MVIKRYSRIRQRTGALRREKVRRGFSLRKLGFPLGSPPPPPQAGSFAISKVSRSSVTEWAGFDVKDDPSPPTIVINNPGGGAEYGLIALYDNDQPTFIRTVDSNTNSPAYVMEICRDPSDGGIIAVGYTGVTTTTISIRDESGTLLGAVNKPVGTHYEWSYYMKFSSTGALEWLIPVSYVNVPTSTRFFTKLYCCTAIGNRFFICGITSMATNGLSPTNAPVIGGLAYPSLPSKSNPNRGLFIVEIDSSNGNGLNISVCDNTTSTTNNINTFYTNFTQNYRATKGIYLAKGSDNQSIILTAGYSGRRDSNLGHLYIGRNKPNGFSTRIFSNTQDQGHAPFIAKFDLELNPLPEVVTQAKNNVLTYPSTKDSLPGKPTEGLNGQIYWAVESPVDSLSNVGENFERSPTNYASPVPATLQQGSINLLSMTSSDFGDPRNPGNFQVGLADINNVAGSNQYSANLTLTNDDQLLLAVVRGSAFNYVKNTSFLGSAPIPFVGESSWLIAIDPTNGQLVWKTEFFGSPNGSVPRGRVYEMLQYKSGPHKDEIHCVGIFGSSTPKPPPPYGVKNANDGLFGYDISTKWSEKISSSRTSIVRLTITTTGDVIPEKCFPISGNSSQTYEAITSYIIF